MATALIVVHPDTGETLPPFLTAIDAAQILHKDEEWVRKACENGELPALPHRPGKAWSIPTLQLFRVLGYEVRNVVEQTVFSEEQVAS